MSDDARYQKAFDDICDPGGKGYVTTDALREKFKEEGLCQEAIEQFVTFLDINKDGTVNKQEFVAALTDNNTADNWRRVFNDFDKDNSGSLSVEEFDQFLSGCDDFDEQRLQAAKNFIKENDLDKDGTVCFKEFLKFLNVKPGH